MPRIALALLAFVSAAAAAMPGIAEPADRFPYAPAHPQDTGLVDHEAYDVSIRLSPARHFLAAEARVVFRSLVAGLGRVHFVIANETLHITGVTSGPDTLAFSYDPGSATLTVELADSLSRNQVDSVRVSYTGCITPALSGALNNFCRLDDTIGFSILPYTWLPAGYDRYYGSRRDEAFACRTAVTVPRGWKAASVGVPVDSFVSDTTETYVWQTDRQVIATCFIAARYGLCARSLNGIAVRYYDFDTSSALTIFQAVGSVLSYLDRTFGACPLRCLSYAENLQVYGAAGTGIVLMPLPYKLAGLTHETAHQWWGVAVRPRYSAEVWLNEGFASYSEVLFQEDSLGLYVRWAELDTMARRYRNVPRAGDRPIVPAPTSSGYYYTIVYSKGAWVLHMLRWVLGDSAFFRGMKQYSLTNHDTSVTVRGFRTAMEQASGQNLGWFFDEWLYRIGYPRYHIDWSSDPAGDSSRVVISLRQTNGSGAPAIFRTPLPMRIELQGPDTNVVIAPSANPQVDTFMVYGHTTGLAVDPDDWVLDSSYITQTGVAEGPSAEKSRGWATATVLRGVLSLPRDMTEIRSGISGGVPRPALLDAAGRKVLDLHAGANDVSHLAPGVYFALSTTRLARVVHVR